MSNYGNGSNIQYIYQYLNGQLVLVPIINNNANNYNNTDYGFYTSSKNKEYFELLPEPEITFNHNVPYKSPYNANSNYFSSHKNLYNKNTYDNDYYKTNENLNNYIPNNNLNQYPNNFIHGITSNIKPAINPPSFRTQPTNTQINRININQSRKANTKITKVEKIQSSPVNFQMNNIKNNIDNNLEININNQNNYHNNEINRNIQNQKEKRPNVKITNHSESIKHPQTEIKPNPNIITDKILSQPKTNIKNGVPDNTTIDKKQVKDSEIKRIPIPNNIKKENINYNPNEYIYSKNAKIKMPSPPDNTKINNPRKDNINNNINETQTQKINNNDTKIITNKEKDNQENQIISNNPTNNQGKNQTVNINQSQVSDVNQNNFENKPNDNRKNKDVEEIVEGINNIEIIPKNNIQYRPLTEKDFNEIFIKGIGIINLGNTCFINSCLQALIHCKLFMQTFFKYSDKLNEKTTPISYNFLLICIYMLDIGKTSRERYIDISYFKYIFGKKHPIFHGYSQNDSQEFCRIFLEDLSNELNEAKNKDLYKTLTNTEGKGKIKRDQEFDFNFKEREKSIIIDLFYSQIITTFTCKCGSEIYSFQKLLDFPLLFPENVQQIDINDLLQNYFKNEEVDFENKCEKCGKVEKHKKAMKISRPPEILIISLQRINETTQKKNECPVIFPGVLNLYDYIDHDIGNDKESYYQLFSVINHQGCINGGHYYTYIKPLKSENWYEFNDSSVRQIQIDKNIYQFAYALFYIKYKYQ